MKNRIKPALHFCLAALVSCALAPARNTLARNTLAPVARAQTPSTVKPGAAGKLPVVREVDLAALKKLLQRDPAKQRPLLVNFWATWCEPCREEFPDLVKIDEQYGQSRLDFITISLDDVSDIEKGVPQYLQKLRAQMPAYLLNVPDPEQAINLVDPKWTGAMPATFLFDSQGTLVFKYTGRIKPDELRAAIDKVMSDESKTQQPVVKSQE